MNSESAREAELKSKEMREILCGKDEEIGALTHRLMKAQVSLSVTLDVCIAYTLGWLRREQDVLEALKTSLLRVKLCKNEMSVK